MPPVEMSGPLRGPASTTHNLGNKKPADAHRQQACACTPPQAGRKLLRDEKEGVSDNFHPAPKASAPSGAEVWGFTTNQPRK